MFLEAASEGLKRLKMECEIGYWKQSGLPIAGLTVKAVLQHWNNVLALGRCELVGTSIFPDEAELKVVAPEPPKTRLTIPQPKIETWEDLARESARFWLGYP